LPDVIFDIREFRKTQAEQAGYVVVYEQTGDMVSWLADTKQKLPQVFEQKLTVYQFIAVRKDLLSEEARNRKPVRFHWKNLSQ